jgi:hypothetical protein
VIEVMDLALVAEAPRLEASHWQVELPGVAPADAARAVEAFLASASAEVDRLTSKGVRRFDTRAAVQTMELDRRAAEERDAGCVILRMVVRHMTPAVRPDDILVALRHMSALAPSSPPLVTRLAQGPAGPDAPVTGAGAAAGGSAPGPQWSEALAALADGPDRHHGGRADQGQKKATRLDAESAGNPAAALKARTNSSRAARSGQ